MGVMVIRGDVGSTLGPTLEKEEFNQFYEMTFPNETTGQAFALSADLAAQGNLSEQMHRTGTLPYNHSGSHPLLDDSAYDVNYTTDWGDTLLWNSMPAPKFPITSFDMVAGIYFHTPEEMLEPWVVNPYFFPILITYIVTFVVGVTGNILVIFLMLGNKDNRK